MTTTHEFDAHIDTQEFREPPYHEQVLVMQEFAEGRDAVLRFEGQMIALEGLKTYLSEYMTDDDFIEHWEGIATALEAIEWRLAFINRRTGGAA